MNLRRNLLSSKKGISTVFGMVFFILIVMIVFASFIIILNQNTSVQQTEAQANQADLARYQEMTTVSIVNPQVAIGTKVVFINCFISDAGQLPAQIIRLWVRDNSTGVAGNLAISPAMTLQPGADIQYFNAIGLTGVSSTDSISFWFVTTRGNDISASPPTSQLNTFTNGALDGQASGSANGTGTIAFSLTTKNRNDLIYLAAVYDDGNYPYSTPTITVSSSPNLVWTSRATSISDESFSYGYNQQGDSIIQSWNTTMSSPGTVTITLVENNVDDNYWAAEAFAVSNVANPTSPFDGSPVTTVGYSSQPAITITTKNANDLVIGAVGIDWQNPVVTPGLGFTQVMGVTSTSGASGLSETAAPRTIWVESMNTTVATKNLSVNCTISTTFPWAIIADAVKLSSGSPITLSPTSGPVGEQVTVTGSGFAANSKLVATVNGVPASFNGATDASGNIKAGAVFTVPVGSTPGKNLVTITDSSFNTASTSFTVTTSSITPLSPTSGSFGSQVTVTGSNFISNSNITVTFDGTSVLTTPFPLIANANGGFSATFKVPLDTAGSKQVTASDGVNSAPATFTVTPSIILNPTSGTIGSAVNIQGYGFASFLPVGFTLTNSTGTFNLQVVPAGLNTNSSGCFSATFTVPSGQTAGAKTISAKDASANLATASFSVAPSITLSPTSGNAGSTVYVSGQGFAGSLGLSATYAGTSVAISVTTTTTSSGTFTGATFTVPTSTTAGAQTVVIKDASSNSAQATFTVNTVSQTISVTMLNSAPIATVTINGGYPNGNPTTTINADGTPNSISFVAGATFTLSFTNSGNTRDGFVVSNAFSATSSQYTANGNSVSATALEQVQNTFSATFSGGNPGSGDTLVLTGTYLGAPSSTILSLNVAGVPSASSLAWSDYNTAVTFLAATTKSSSTEQWVINGASPTNPLKTGGSTYSKTYYNQYSIAFQYSGGGSGYSAPTVSYTQFGGAGAPVTAVTSGATAVWVDATTTYTYTNPLSGSTSSVQWATSSGTGTASASGTVSKTYYNQYSVTPYYTLSDSSSPTVTNVVSFTQFGRAATATPTKGTSGGTAVWMDSGSSVTYTSPIVSGSERWMVSSADTGTYAAISSVSASGSATVNYYDQYSLTVTASQSGAIGGSFQITYTQFGTIYTNQPQTTSFNSWADATTTATVGSPQSLYNGYTFSSYTNNPATMNSAQTITLQYKATPGVTVSFSVNPVKVGSATTVTATVTGAGGVTPTGTVTFSGGTGTYSPSNGQATLSGSGGTATCQVTFTPSSTTGSPVTITASYGGDGNYLTNSGTGSLTVSKATPGVTVSFSVNPVKVGSATTVTATVTGAGGVTPTGTVTFSGGTGTYSPSNGQATLSGSGGTATCQVTFTPSSTTGSPVTITASYGGDGNYATNSGTGSLTVSKATPGVTVSFSVNPVNVGSATTVTATVTGAGGVTPTGTVTFSGGTGTYSPSNGQATLSGSGGTATCQVTFTPSSTTGSPVTITASYGGDGNYATNSGTGSLTVSKATPGVTVSFSVNPVNVGSATTVTATVTGAGGVTPTGTVTFSGGTGTYSPSNGQATLSGSGGTATCQVTFTPSSTTGSPVTITASYGGDGNYATNSGTGSLTVSKATPGVTVSFSVNPVKVGSATTVTATVTGAGGVTPTGTVTFSGGTGTYSPSNGQATLSGSGGTATCQVTFTPSSTTGSPVTITASYGGDGNYATNSGTGSLTVKATPGVTVSFSVNPVNVGSATTVTATVTGAGGVTPTGTVTFSGGTGTYSPSNGQATLSGSGGTATCQVTFTPSSTTGSPVTITASYGGDGNYATNSGTGSLTVNPHIALVQGPKRGTSTSSTISVTLSNTPTSGDVLIAVIGTDLTSTNFNQPSTITISSISQTGVTWTKQVVQTDSGGSYFAWYAADVEIWLGTVSSGASTSVTITLSGSANGGAVADIGEYSGIATSPLDKTAVNPSSTASTSTTTGTTTTTSQASELWIGGVTVEAGATQSSSNSQPPTNGFTLSDGSAYNSAMSVAYLQNIVSATGTASSGTTTTSSNRYVGCIATFKAA